MVTGVAQRRSRFELRISPTERADLRALAEENGMSESRVVKDLVRDAIAAKRPAQVEQHGSRLFREADQSPEEAA